MVTLQGIQGEYELSDRVGKGASLTYRAIDKRAQTAARTDPVVFIKFAERRTSRSNWDTQDQSSIDQAGSADYCGTSSRPRDTCMLARENFAHSKVSHPQIIGATDRELSPSTPRFLVFPFVRGRDLYQIIKKRGPLSARESFWLVEDVCDGLDAMHARGLVHRDIKPGNIVVDSEQARVADLGLCYHSDIADWDPPNSKIGTPFYMSPEQVRAQPLSPATDVYGLGATLYESMTGVLPFTAENSVALMYKILDEKPEQPHITPAIDNVIIKSLSKKQKDRFQSAGEFKEAFREAVADKRTYPVSTPKAISMWSQICSKLHRKPASPSPETVE